MYSSLDNRWRHFIFSLNITRKLASLDLRSRHLVLNSTFGLLIKGGALLLALFMLPAYMRYFNSNTILGLWFTVTSVVSWILTFDFGIGNGLRNHLVKALAAQDTLEAKKYISSAYITIGIITFFVSIVGFYLIPFINLNAFFNISASLVPKALLLQVVRITFISIMANFLLKLVNSIFYALQQSAVPGFLYLISNLILYVFLNILSADNLSSKLRYISYVQILSSNLPLLVATVVIFTSKLKLYIPRWRYFELGYASSVLRLGGLFFIAQIMYMLITNTNEFLITWLIGPEKVVEYQVYNKFFALIGTLFYLLLIPVWSAVTDAWAREDIPWIIKTYRHLRQAALCTIVGETALVVFLQAIVNLWLKERSIQINVYYSLLFAISSLLFIWNAIISSIVNGIGRMKIQVIFMTIGALLNFPLAYIFVRITGSWISIIIANIISMLPYCIVQPIWINRYLGTDVSEKSPNTPKEYGAVV